MPYRNSISEYIIFSEIFENLRFWRAKGLLITLYNSVCLFYTNELFHFNDIFHKGWQCKRGSMNARIIVAQRFQNLVCRLYSIYGCIT